MSKHQIDDSAWVLRMSRLTRVGTAELVSRDQILRRERRQGKNHFPGSADHEQDWQPCRVDPYGSVRNLEETFLRWDVTSNFGAVTRTGIFSYKIK